MFSKSGGPATGSLPFDITVKDPKQRVQAYLDRYRADKEYAVSTHIFHMKHDIDQLDV